MNIRKWMSGLLVGAAIIAGQPTWASGGDVSVGGQLLFTIKAAAEGRSIEERVDSVTERLRPILSDPYLKPSDIHLFPQPDQSVRIMVKRRLLVTVTQEDAHVNDLSVMRQAMVWQRELMRTLPLVSVKPPRAVTNSR